MALTLISLALLALATALVLVERRRQPPEAVPRDQLVTLSQGVTRRRWTGPPRGAKVLMIHGLTTPSDVWGGIADRLAGAGYRVLTYDLYGRGGSSAAPGRQDAAFFRRQIDDLLEAEQLEDDLTVIGYSMGGAIAADWAANNTDRVRRVILLAPAGVEPQVLPVWLRVPPLSDWVFRLVYPRWLAGRLRRANERSEVPGVVEAQIAQTGRRGFAPAVLSSLRWLASGPFQTAHRRLMTARVPVIAIWGSLDRVVPITGLGELARLNRRAAQEVIDKAGHGLPYTHARQVSDMILAVLREG